MSEAEIATKILKILLGSENIDDTITIPAAADPANDVSVYGALRKIFDENTTLYNDWIDTGRLDNILDGRAPASEYDTEMARITANVALASVVGALTDAAAQDGDATTSTLQSLVKGIHDVLWDADGVAAWAAPAAPGNGVSMAEVLRAVYDDTHELQGDWVNAGRLDTILDAIAADVVDTKEGKVQIFEKSITAALNAGVTTVGTITTQPCWIEGVVIHADTGAHADMTTCAVEGGTGQVVTFISTTDAIEANLDAADEQVGWTGAVRMAANDVITIDLQGTGATAADLTVTVKYRACVDGGYIT